MCFRYPDRKSLDNGQRDKPVPSNPASPPLPSNEITDNDSTACISNKHCVRSGEFGRWRRSLTSSFPNFPTFFESFSPCFVRDLALSRKRRMFIFRGENCVRFRSSSPAGFKTCSIQPQNRMKPISGMLVHWCPTKSKATVFIVIKMLRLWFVQLIELSLVFMALLLP